MAYVYEHQPPPANFTGVDVHLLALDSNGNWQDLGTATTDIKGHFSMSWAPEISGDFQVYAYFDGTNGYWPSDAETSFNMVEAPATPTPQPTAPPTVSEQYFLPVSIGMIIAIVVVIALLAVMLLRKRP